MRSDSSFEDEFGFTLLPTNASEKNNDKSNGQASPIDSGIQNSSDSNSSDSNSLNQNSLNQNPTPNFENCFINSFVDSNLSRGVSGNLLPHTPRMGVAQTTINRNHPRCASRVSKASSFGTSGVGTSIVSANSFTKCPVIDSSRLKIVQEIGKGEFGRVQIDFMTFLQRFMTAFNILSFKISLSFLFLCQFDEHKLVAMKQLTLVSECVLRDFEREIEIMQKIKSATLDCPYIVKLIGTCQTNNITSGMITEYHENGDLHGFLQKNYDDLQVNTLWHIAGQVCAGMLELSKHSIVHRDLAARNIMVGKNYKISIGDFGMSRDTFTESYYKISGRAILPIRWMAWECVLNGTFSSASDVWAFGVTVWEIFSYCKVHPFAGHSDEEIIRNFYRFLGNEGEEIRLKLKKPEKLDETSWKILEECWLREKEDRPGFRDLAKVFRV